MNFLKGLNKYDKFQKILKDLTKINFPQKIYKHLPNQTNISKIDTNILKKGITLPMHDLIFRNSKSIRPYIALSVAELLSLPERKDDLLLKIAALNELTHNNTLIIDDIQDSSKIRRGEPCTYIKYGIDTSLNSSNFYSLYFNYRFIELIDTRDKIQEYEILECYMDCVRDLYFGVTFDVEWHKLKDYNDVPSFENFYLMLMLKTSRLMKFSIELMRIFYDIPEEKVEVISKSLDEFGIAFQINDDLINITNEKYFDLKGMGEDIIEKKMSFLVLYFLKCEKTSKEKKDKFFDLFKKDDKTKEEILEIIQILKSTDVLKSGINEIKKYHNRSVERLDKNFDKNNPGLIKLKNLFRDVLENKYYSN